VAFLARNFQVKCLPAYLQIPWFFFRMIPSLS
jgi:hypothetical protein